MDTSDITLIRTISEQGSITRAAAFLHLSQPTLSRKLARLESSLKTTLFHRSSTGLLVTEVARYIIESAKPLDAQLKRIERHVEQMTQLETGEVRVGVGPIIEQVLLPEVLARFVRETADVQIAVVTDRADRLLKQLRDADLDLIAGPFRADEDPDLVGFPLISDYLVTVARAGHPVFAEGGKPHVRSLPLAAPLPQGTVGNGGNDQVPGNQRIASDNYPLLKRVTLDSDCICQGPWHLFRDELESGELREVQIRRSVHWQSACLVRPESVNTPLVRLLISLFVEESGNYQDAAERPPP